MTHVDLKPGMRVEIESTDHYYLVYYAPAPESIRGRERISFDEVTDLLKRHGKKSALAQFDPMHFMR